MADTPLTPIANLKAKADDQGRLKVVVSGAGSGGTSATDGDAFVANTTAGTPAMGAYQSAVSAVTDGDVAVVGMTAQRALKVTLFDTAGNEQAAGGGTQYTEDAAAAANPVGTALIVIREDARAGGLVTTDGDNVACRGTNAGELYVKDFDVEDRVDGIEGLLTTIDSDTGALAGTVGGSELQVDLVSPGTAAGSLGKAEDAAHTTGDVGVAALTVRQDTAAALSGTDGDYQPIITDGSGRVHVNVGNTVTVGSHAVTNAGTFAVQESGTHVLVDDAAFTPATTKVSMVGFEADESSTDSVDEGDGGAARMTLDRKVIVTPQPHTTGGLSIFRSLDLDETEEEVKGTAGQVYGWFIANLATSTRFVKFYNDTAANVIVGTTAPVLTFPIPGNSTDDIAANALGEHGITFSAAITVAATTGIADNDTGAPGANEVVVNLFYK
jgi:hypothetical protein